MGFLETCPKRTSLDRATGPDDLAARNGRYPHLTRQLSGEPHFGHINRLPRPSRASTFHSRRSKPPVVPRLGHQLYHLHHPWQARKPIHDDHSIFHRINTPSCSTASSRPSGLKANDAFALEYRSRTEPCACTGTCPTSRPLATSQTAI